MTQRFQIVILIALTATIYIATAARPSLLDDADSSHAMAAQAMLERGDWAVLHMNGIAWLEKPPVHFWLVAASFALLGENAFATRLPAALAIVGLVLLVYSFGCRFFGNRAGFYAALVMCTSVGTFIFTRVMIPEAIYAFEFTAIFYLFLRAWTGTLDARIAAWAVPALIGVAALTRAGIGLLFPLTIIFLFIAAVNGWQRLFSRGVSPFVIGGLVFAVVAVPWHLVAGLRAPGFFWFYFINEQFRRALGTRIPMDYAAVPLVIWWPAHLLWFFPWSIFLPYALREIPGPHRWRVDPEPAGQARLFLLVWAAVILLFFTLVTGSRLEYYAFGSWPAVSLLIGLGLARAEEGRDAWLPRLQTLLAIIGVLIAGVLGLLVWVSSGIPATDDISQFLSSHPTDFYRLAMANFFDLTPQAFAALRVPAVSAALALSIGLSVAWWLRKQGRTWAPNVVAAFAMLAFFQSANLAYATFEPRLSSRPLADELLKWLQPSDRLVIYGEFDAGSSLTFYTHRQALIYNGRFNGLEFGSYFPDAPPIFLTDRDFPSVWDGPARVFMFVPPDQRQQALLRLPLDRAYFVAERGGKALFVNQPLEPGQLSLEASVARSDLGALPRAAESARNQQRDHVGEWAVAVEHALSRGGAAW
jgi:4-amino-4-deoxy-L-arabinose transferase-like glycosyltransferase